MTQFSKTQLPITFFSRATTVEPPIDQDPFNHAERVPASHRRASAHHIRLPPRPPSHQDSLRRFPPLLPSCLLPSSPKRELMARLDSLLMLLCMQVSETRTTRRTTRTTTTTRTTARTRTTTRTPMTTGDDDDDGDIEGSVAASMIAFLGSVRALAATRRYANIRGARHHGLDRGPGRRRRDPHPASATAPRIVPAPRLVWTRPRGSPRGYYRGTCPRSRVLCVSCWNSTWPMW